MMYKLKGNSTGDEKGYDHYYESSLTLSAQIPNVILGWLNIFVNLG